MANEAQIPGNILDPITPIQYRIIKQLQKGSMSRDQLVVVFNLPRTTLYDNLMKLKKQEILTTFKKNNGKRGRPKIFYQLIKEGI